MHTSRLASALLVAALCTGAHAGTIVYVDDDASPGGDGQSWNTAFRYLQDGLAVAVAGDEIRVGQGIYRPDQSEYGNASQLDRGASFHLQLGIRLMGGFAGYVASNPDDRDPQLYLSTLSGDLMQDDGPNFTHYDDNSYTVLSSVDTDESTHLNGFVISGGNADIGVNDPDHPERFRGGGLWLRNAPIQMSHCVIEMNSASLGGGIYAHLGEAPSISFCRFLHNRATAANGGGGLYFIDFLAVSVSDCDFWRNHATEGAGGGLRAFRVEHCKVRRCSFSDNSAFRSAGVSLGDAIHDPQMKTAELFECRIVNNSAELFAGAATITANFKELRSCQIVGNTSVTMASLLLGHEEVVDAYQTVIVNSVIADNVANSIGAGIVVPNFTHIANCVVSGNSASGDCPAICVTAGSIIANTTVINNVGTGIQAYGPAKPGVTATNCIVYGNTTSIEIEGDGVIEVSHSNIQGGWEGVGNIDADPMFVQPGTRNFRLAHGSPCLDAGSNDALPADSFDLDGDGDVTEPLPIDLAGEPRILSGTVDMGAYEGAFDMLPPAAMHDDLDPSEFAILNVNGGQINREESIVVFVRNVSSQHNATVVVTDQRDPTGRSGADTPAMQIDSDIPNGQMVIRASVPFALADVGSSDPLGSDLTMYDAPLDYWPLAAALNAVPSPGHDEPIGDRHSVEGETPMFPPVEMGDYGVFWNPTTQRGFAWVTTDHSGEYGLRFGSCPGDSIPYGGDHVIDIFDLIALIQAWNSDARWSDADGNGVVNVDDLMLLMDAWGGCGP